LGNLFAASAKPKRFVPHDDDLFQRLIEIHKWVGYALILCMLVHVGAALRHHFMFSDDTLRRMLP